MHNLGRKIFKALVGMVVGVHLSERTLCTVVIDAFENDTESVLRSVLHHVHHEHWVRKSVPIPIQPHNVEGCAGARRTDKSNLVATMECALQHLPARSTVVR